MDFKKFSYEVSERIKWMCEGATYLFEVALDKQALWELYLSSFAPGDNELYIKRTEHDCSCCRHFIKAFGNVVTIKEGKIETIWAVKGVGKFQPVVDALDAFVKLRIITDIFVTDTCKFGSELTHGQIESGDVIKWNHFYVTLPASMKTCSRDTTGTKRGELRDTRNVLKRSLDEISAEATETILDLIGQGSLYKGEEWTVLQKFSVLQREYAAATDKDLYCWAKSLEVGPVIGRIRNHSIGTLLTGISDGGDLVEEVKKYEAMVAPSNYKRPKAIFTKKMVERAQATVEDLGLTSSLPRRYAVMDDITINNILFANRDARSRMDGGAFEELMTDVKSNRKKFERLDEVPVDTFVREVLPGAESVELYLENRHAPSMVSLIAPQNVDSPTMFKWGNGFSWAYSGNITDSMKERVKAAGGRVDGVLRFSIQWNEERDNQNDFDAHCREPSGGDHLYFQHMNSRHTGGNLDVDIIHPGDKTAVENITWPSREQMILGVYKLFVHNYSNRGGRSGFRAEVEFDGQCHSFDYPNDVRQNENVQVAEVTLTSSGEFKIKEMLPSTLSSREVWGLNTNEFHPVTIGLFSPNYWNEQDGIGHRHFFFMLDKCRNPEQPNGFFNEFLQQDFMKHKRVFEALGAKMKVAESDDQLSGIGFSSTKRNSFVCKVRGRFNRTIKVNI